MTFHDYLEKEFRILEEKRMHVPQTNQEMWFVDVDGNKTPVFTSKPPFNNVAERQGYVKFVKQQKMERDWIDARMSFLRGLFDTGIQGKVSDMDEYDTKHMLRQDFGLDVYYYQPQLMEEFKGLEGDKELIREKAYFIAKREIRRYHRQLKWFKRINTGIATGLVGLALFVDIIYLSFLLPHLAVIFFGYFVYFKDWKDMGLPRIPDDMMWYN